MSDLNIEVLILADTVSLDTITSWLETAGDRVHWHQIPTLAQYRNRLNSLSSIDLILWDAASSQITLDRAIDCLLTDNLKIPLIAVNGESSIPTAIAAVKAGAVDYLPADSLSRLPQAIAQALSKPDFLCLESRCTSQSEQQLQKLISENADGIIVVDEQGIVQFVNPAALELFGKSSTALIGESLGFPVVNNDFLEVDIPVSTDKTLVAQMRVSKIKWQGMTAFVVSLRDITQLKQAELERTKLLQEAQAANRAKDEFLAILSHELRTPLNPIVGWSQLLAQGNLPQAQIKKGAEIIQRNAMLQTRLISDILDISRIIQGKLKLEVVPVNLVKVINNALETVNLAAQAKSIKLETELATDIGLVQGDETRLQQVVWNLLSNAVKFTPNDGIVNISLTAIQTEQSLDCAEIKIKDSGKGIAPEFIPYVFDYFRQAESTKSRSEGGLGLGLAIVRRLVELHGGEVNVTSAGLGMGATFTVSLPLFNSRERTKF